MNNAVRLLKNIGLIWSWTRRLNLDTLSCLVPVLGRGDAFG